MAVSVRVPYLCWLNYQPSTSCSSNFVLVSPNRCTRTTSLCSQSLKLNKDPKSFRVPYRFSSTIEDEDEDEENCSFDEAVALFNKREYYKCHDCLEALWNDAEEPTRTLFHAILQCAVGFFHLFNQNHKGAMMELGEGLCKLRKMNFATGPFHQFEKDISETLDFIYRTQIELAACTDDMCLAMDQTERSYQLLGDYGAGQHLYHLETHHNANGNATIMYLVFNPHRSYASQTQRVKLPILNATQQHLLP